MLWYHDLTVRDYAIKVQLKPCHQRSKYCAIGAKVPDANWVAAIAGKNRLYCALPPGTAQSAKGMTQVDFHSWNLMLKLKQQ